MSLLEVLECTVVCGVGEKGIVQGIVVCVLGF